VTQERSATAAAAGDEARAGTNTPPRDAQPWLQARQRALGAWLVRERLDIAIVVALTLTAAALRLPALGSVPLGLHGDEAWTGLDARRILDEGWIGPYVFSALGQPTGPLYFTALVFSIFGDSAASIRLSMALLGVATIPLTFMAFSLMFNRTTAAFAAFILLGMTWHLHLSRMGFMVISWPLAEMAVLWLLWLAFRRESTWLYGLAGLLCGLGLYSYNAYPLFLPLPALALIWMFFRQAPEGRRRHLAACAVFAGAALIAAAPLIAYVTDHWWEYRYHQRVVSVFESPAWEEGGAVDRAGLLWDRARDWHRGLFFGGVVDYGDGLSTPGHPPVGPVIWLLAVVGLVMTAWRARRLEYALALAAAVLFPLGALLTVDYGMYRRTLGLAPFVALLAALPLAWLFGRLRERPGRARDAAFALLALPLAAGAAASCEYFGATQDRREVQFVMVQELEAASRYMDTLPEGTPVYFYSGRWFLRYETRRYLAPDVEGYDITGATVPAPGQVIPYEVYTDGPAAFVFLFPFVPFDESDPNFYYLWPYPTIDGHARSLMRALEEVQTRYPGGEVTEHVEHDRVFFRAYYLNAASAR